MNEHLLQMASHFNLQTPCVMCHFLYFKVKKLKPRRAGNMSKIRELTSDRGKGHPYFNSIMGWQDGSACKGACC